MVTETRRGEGMRGEAPLLVPAAARRLFGERLPLAVRYVELLATTGISHGLVGPREASRLWERHVLNSAAIEPLLSENAEVADVGSGAGLPGTPLAIARPDLAVTLVEPLLRRTTWLEATLSELGIRNVTVVRARAEALWGRRRFQHVTARAVARTGELAGLSVPLLTAHGSLHALKGERADAELAQDASVLARLGATSWFISRQGEGLVDPPVVVVSVVVGDEPPVPTPSRAVSSRRRAARVTSQGARRDR